jgi:O-acetyl-ADP-ribose deacetylase (regulator of RNase III)
MTDGASLLARAFGGSRIELLRGDITEEATDAIVNAANGMLLGGGGVDGAIHHAGGPAIREECRTIRALRGGSLLPAGEAVITGAGRLKCRHVIHTVGPIWRGGGAEEAETLARCYRASLELAEAHGLVSIAFPSISTGAYGYPVERAAAVALATVRDALLAGRRIALVRFVLFSDSDYDAHAEALAALPA